MAIGDELDKDLGAFNLPFGAGNGFGAPQIDLNIKFADIIDSL